MKKEIRMSLTDLYTGYVCTAALLYLVAGAAYFVGKTRAKIEIAEKIKEAVSETTREIHK